MIIKVCGMREPDNIRAVVSLGIDLMGFIFYENSPRYVRDIPVGRGVIPYSAGEAQEEAGKGLKTVGVFVNAMPQTVAAQVCNCHLDYIQLHGNETASYIGNLRSTLVSDNAPDIKFIKALSVREADDVKRWREYEGLCDLLLFDTKCEGRGGSGKKFDWSVLDAYDGHVPFLLSGGIGPDDAEEILKVKHPQFAGIDLNSRFETEPGLKDIGKLRQFIDKIREYE